jgi:hypothetical protein
LGIGGDIGIGVAGKASDWASVGALGLALRAHPQGMIRRVVINTKIIVFTGLHTAGKCFMYLPPSLRTPCVV